MAGKVNALKLRLDTFTTKFEAFQKAVSDESITHLTNLYQDYRIAQDAAIVAADKLFADEPVTICWFRYLARTLGSGATLFRKSSISSYPVSFY